MACIKVRINVGGTVFETCPDTLGTFPDTRLSKLHVKSDYYDERNDEYFFDRNPHIFSFILEAYRTGELHIPKDVCGKTIQQEMDFWGLSSGNISECCWKAFYKTDSDFKTIKDLTESYYSNTNICHLMPGNKRSLRMKLWLFLDEPRSSRLAQVWSLFMMAVVILSALSSSLETMPDFREPLPEEEARRADGFLRSWGYTNDSNTVSWLGKLHPSFCYIDTVCFALLTLDTCLRMVSTPNIRSYFKSVLNLADIVSITSFWTAKGLESGARYLEDSLLFTVYTVFACLVVLKILRFCRMYRQISALHVLGLSIRSSKSEIAVLSIMLLILVSVFGHIMFLAEMVEGNSFGNVFVAMYWALITLTTVGYGDVQPVTPQGHVVASACAICGVLMLALPIGVIAASFNNLYSHHRYAMRHIEVHKLTSVAGNVCKFVRKGKRAAARREKGPKPDQQKQ